ncbi:hypothetical protein GOODEAATRI_031555, partial [Goodea atripinnis]
TNVDHTEERSTPSEAPAASSVSDSAPSSSAAAQPPVGRRRRVPPQEEPSEVERALLEALQNRPPQHPPPRIYSSMEHFLLGLAPSLERLPLHKQEFIKLKVMQMIFEHSTVVLNLDLRTAIIDFTFFIHVAVSPGMKLNFFSFLLSMPLHSSSQCKVLLYLSPSVLSHTIQALM